MTRVNRRLSRKISEIARAMSGWQRPPGRSGLRVMTMSPNPYRGFRFPPEVIEHAGWLHIVASV
jgi:hypothetical protein